ncbi:MAG TPA: DUF4097 family beta strand repeat-containing protein [Cyclobacteriaceae bacterium]
MKNIIPIIVLLFITATGFAQSNDSGEIPIPLSDPSKRAKLKVHINYGSINVKGTARKDILVKYTGESDRDNDDNDRGKDRSKNGLRRIGGGTLDLEVSENSNFVKVQSDSWNNKCNLIIEVPNGIDMTLHTYNDGDIEVANVQGEIELTNYNGEITAENVSGSVVATTYNGEIKVTFDKITENTPMSFVTYNGDIDLTFPATLKASLKMKTQQGEILTGFDVKVSAATPVKSEQTKGGTFKVTVDEWVRGDVNGGGPEIIMRNYNGDILVRKK